MIVEVRVMQPKGVKLDGTLRGPFSLVYLIQHRPVQGGIHKFVKGRGIMWDGRTVPLTIGGARFQ